MRIDSRHLAGVVLLVLVIAGAAVAVLPQAIESRMAALPQASRSLLAARAQWLQDLPPDQREALRARVAAWDALPADERARLREHWQAWQAMPVDRQALLRYAAREFAALPADEREALRAEFDALPANERRGWLLGPVLGAEWIGLEPLFMQVPAREREPLLEVLHQMPPVQLRDLATLAQRTPPQEREALRQALLATRADARAQWLEQRRRQ